MCIHCSISSFSAFCPPRSTPWIVTDVHVSAFFPVTGAQLDRNRTEQERTERNAALHETTDPANRLAADWQPPISVRQVRGFLECLAASNGTVAWSLFQPSQYLSVLVQYSHDAAPSSSSVVGGHRRPRRSPSSTLVVSASCTRMHPQGLHNFNVMRLRVPFSALNQNHTAVSCAPWPPSCIDATRYVPR